MSSMTEVLMKIDKPMDFHLLGHPEGGSALQTKKRVSRTSRDASEWVYSGSKRDRFATQVWSGFD